MKSEKALLAGLSRSELTVFVKHHQLQSFRANQLADWVFQKHIIDPDRMTNLPAGLRQTVKDELLAPSGRVTAIDTAEDGTKKLLIEFTDGEAVEMVIIPSGERITFCLSTQAGCPVRCRFCASGATGLKRNLQRGEMIEQLLFGIAELGRLPDNLVFMGIGEGLLNFDELAAALELITSPEGFGMAQRRITVSTSGIVPGIRRLAALGKEYTLAISLHAVEDEVRQRLIPDAYRYPIAEILAAADDYLATAGRMVTFEYTLLDSINDSMEDAAKLAGLSRRHHAKINLIPYNATTGAFRRPSPKTIEAFAAAVERAGGQITIRRERGSDRNAACGQLRNSRSKS